MKCLGIARRIIDNPIIGSAGFVHVGRPILGDLHRRFLDDAVGGQSFGV